MANLRGCPKCNSTAGPGKYRVDYAAIMRAFTDQGVFGPDIHSLAREAKNIAEKTAPKRTGKMRRAHYINIEPPRGYHRWFSLRNRMGYAPFVQHGTKGKGTGYITPIPPNKLLELRPAPYSMFGPNDGRRFQKKVKGQKGDDWLRWALFRALEVRGLRVR